jgi:hypothetical protein
VAKSGEDLSDARIEEALRDLEAMADRGAIHPDLSFNRGLGYLLRARSSTGKPGDLGQAAAGFAEALQLMPEDAAAARGLSEAHRGVAKRKSRADTSTEDESLGLVERALLATKSLTLFVLAGLGSLVLCAGLVGRRSAREPWRSGSLVACLVGSLLLSVAWPLAQARHHLLEGARMAVVVSDVAPVLASDGSRLPGRLPLRESTVVFVRPAQNGLAALVNFGERGFLPAENLRLLSTNREF